ncbi:MAG: peptide deformylase [Proteobacteria bacterium]|nr:peptide deformylase [Pseudomonadota bacterium]
MALLEVLIFPHRILRQKCEPVTAIDDATVKLLKDMAETMYASKGIGLAAPQVGILKRVIMLDVGQGLVSLINPEISSSDGASVREEGCLCLPEIYVNIERKEKIEISGIDPKGKPVSFEADGLLARALQHEIDHLHGTLIVDRLSRLKRDLVIRKFRKLQLKAQK